MEFDRFKQELTSPSSSLNQGLQRFSGRGTGQVIERLGPLFQKPM
jgi:hypothetical protein